MGALNAGTVTIQIGIFAALFNGVC